MRMLALSLSAGALALAGCHSHAKGDKDGDQVSAEGKAEEGKISVHAPGFNLTLSLPKEMAREVRADRDNKMIYPGSSMLGIAVAAGKGGDKSGDSEVEMRFRTAAPLDQVAAWYRDRARGAGFSLQGVTREGDAVVVRGTQNSDHHPFKVRLVAQPGGGTDGRLTIHHTD
jgi:hypothetical protein